MKTQSMIFSILLLSCFCAVEAKKNHQVQAPGKAKQHRPKPKKDKKAKEEGPKVNLNSLVSAASEEPSIDKDFIQKVRRQSNADRCITKKELETCLNSRQTKTGKDAKSKRALLSLFTTMAIANSKK